MLCQTLQPSPFTNCVQYFFQAVQDYIHAQRVLERYGNMASFQGIQKDCEMILGDLKQRLRDQFKNKEASAKDLAKAVDLLLQLSEPADQLCAEFLAHAETRLEEQLGILDSFQEQVISMKHKFKLEFL